MVLSKPDAHIQKPGATIDRGTNRYDVTEGAAHVAPVRRRKRGPGHVSAALPLATCRDSTHGPVTPPGAPFGL